MPSLLTNPLINQSRQIIQQAEAELKDHFAQLDELCHANTKKVLQAFHRAGLDEHHFSSVSGYGHDDQGRQATDAIFAQVFGAQAGCVRLQFVSGTHAIYAGLRGALAPNKKLLCLTGSVYDTLEPVIGIRDAGPQSLTTWGVQYDSIDPFTGNGFDFEKIKAESEKIKATDVAFIQRSKGYSTRPTLSIDQIQQLITFAKQTNPNLVVVVDNCYGEFTHTTEPTDYGADLICGSLIKNPGGGIVPTGGYVCGKAQWVESAAESLTAPGIGVEGGYTFEQTRTLLQGLYFAPMVVKEALKSMRLFASVFETLGYNVLPTVGQPQTDIIQTIELGNEEKVLQFAKAIQQASPVSSRLTPIPAVTPGYADSVVMAGGTFIFGSTIELSCDAPMREPYVVFLQGGLNYSHSRFVLEQFLDSLN